MSEKQGASGAIPKSEINEESITNFDQKTGDSSRGILIAVVVLAALLLGGIWFFSQPQTASEYEQTQPTK